MLASMEFEYDLAAHKVYALQKTLWMYEKEDEEYQKYRQCVRWLNQMRDRRTVLRDLQIELRAHTKGSPEYKRLSTKFDTLKGELLLRASKISYEWEGADCGRGTETAERARYNIKMKYQ